MIHMEKILQEYPADIFDTMGASIFWPREPGEKLIHSLRDTGQCVPVIVEGVSDTVRLLAGQRRVKALAGLGMTVLAYRTSTLTPLERGLIFLESNYGQPLDDGMLVRALRYFSTCAEDIDTVAPYLGLDPHSRLWKSLLQWLRLPCTWDVLLENGHVPLPLGVALRCFAPEELPLLEPLFRELSWSKNNALHFVSWFWETSRVRECSPAALMDALDLGGILSMDLSPKDTMTRLLESVRQARYPRLAALEKNFRRMATDVVADSRWRLIQPDHFETGGLELQVRIKNAGELEEATRQFETIARHAVWNELERLGHSDE